MRFGFNTLALYQARASPDAYVEIARKGDELDYDFMWMGHHLVFPTQISTPYPYSANGIGPHTPDMHRLDPWVLFAHLAAVTKRLSFTTGVYLLPLVNPFVTARAIATADVLSGGRMIVGVGVGWNQEEYATVGTSFGNRGRRTNEILQILKQLWSEDTIEFHGRYYDFAPVKFEPKPMQRPHPPLLYGGFSPPALGQAALLNGCYLPTNDVHVLEPLLLQIRQLRIDAGLEHEPFDVTVGAPVPLTTGAIRRLEDTGVTRVVFEIGSPPLSLDAEPVAATTKGWTANLERVAESTVLSFPRSLTPYESSQTEKESHDGPLNDHAPRLGTRFFVPNHASRSPTTASGSRQRPTAQMAAVCQACANVPYALVDRCRLRAAQAKELACASLFRTEGGRAGSRSATLSGRGEGGIAGRIRF
jgi:probable F420-dependent oxidoreductase